MAPYWRTRSCLLANSMKNPVPTMSRAALVTLNATIWAVTVVPMLAPMMMPMDWDIDSSPAVMNPTTRTVVTEDDWITAVTKAPVRAPVKRLVVRRARICFIRSPATALRASAIRSIPNRNRARPPNRPTAMVPHWISPW